MIIFPLFKEEQLWRKQKSKFLQQNINPFYLLLSAWATLTFGGSIGGVRWWRLTWVPPEAGRRLAGRREAVRQAGLTVRESRAAQLAAVGDGGLDGLVLVEVGDRPVRSGRMFSPLQE